jgi:3',5'-cyclic AMP phosphodiesterase CpdA
MNINTFVLVLLLLFGASAAHATSGNQLSYAGFADIDLRKNSFIVIGDTQKTSYLEFWREKNDRERILVNREILRRDPSFVLHLGDLTTMSSSQEHWSYFDNMNAEYRSRKIPYFPVLGNHDYYISDTIALKNYFSRFQFLENRRWYSFTWKNTAFIMLDSNMSALTQQQMAQQAEWYVQELKKFDEDKRIAHIIVCCHNPPFTNSTVVGPDLKVKTYFAAPFIKAPKAKIFFSGHSHSYERFRIGDKIFIVSGGGGGPRHTVMTDKAKQRTVDLYDGPALRFFHFCEIKLRAGSLIFRVVALGSDGEFNIIENLNLQ